MHQYPGIVVSTGSFDNRIVMTGTSRLTFNLKNNKTVHMQINTTLYQHFDSSGQTLHAVFYKPD